MVRENEALGAPQLRNTISSAPLQAQLSAPHSVHTAANLRYLSVPRYCVSGPLDATSAKCTQDLNVEHAVEKSTNIQHRVPGGQPQNGTTARPDP